MNESSPLNRRKVLKLSAGAVGLSSLPGVVAGSNNGAIAGVTYDTLTHKTGPKARGELSRDSNNKIVGGRMNIQGYELPLDKLAVVDDGKARTKYEYEYTNNRYRNNSSLRLELSDWGDQVAGYITRPDQEFGKLGFVLIDSEEESKRSIEKSFKYEKRWAESEHEFKIPNKGVPTDSSISRLHEILGEKGGDKK